MIDELSGIEDIEGVAFEWKASGIGRHDTVTVRHPDYGTDTTFVRGLSIITIVHLLAREMLTKREEASVG